MIPPASFCWAVVVAGWAGLLLTAPASVSLMAGLLLLAVAAFTGFVQHVVAETRQDFAVSSSMLLLPVLAAIATVAGPTHATVRVAAWVALVGGAFDVIRRAAAARHVRRRTACSPHRDGCPHRDVPERSRRPTP